LSPKSENMSIIVCLTISDFTYLYCTSLVVACVSEFDVFNNLGLMISTFCFVKHSH